jgi:hypothetical protein
VRRALVTGLAGVLILVAGCSSLPSGPKEVISLLTSGVGGTFAVAKQVVGALPAHDRFDLELGEPIDVEAASLVEGDSHYRDVLAALGPPATVTSLGTGFAFQYEHLEIDEVQWGLSLQFGVEAAWASSEGSFEVLVLRFDPDGILASMRHHVRELDLGNTIGFSHLLVVRRKFGTEGYTQPAVQHNFGLAMLDPLPEALNSPQSLISGASGFEQRNTPDGVGQQIEVPSDHGATGRRKRRK